MGSSLFCATGLLRGLGVTALTVAVVAAGLPAAAAPAGGQGSNAPAGPNGSAAVRRVPARAVVARTAPSGPGRPQVKPRSVSWPKPVTATVPVDARARRVSSAPVWVTAPERGAVPGQAVAVRTFDHQTVDALGGVGVGFTVQPAGNPAGPGESVRVEIDTSAFAAAQGGDLAARLRLVSLPACAVTTPDAARCRRRTPVPGALTSRTGDGSRVTATVPARAAGDVFVLADTPDTGDSGTFAATPLASASRWAVGQGAGDFSWSYPIPAVPVPGGTTPTLSADYDSQTVDGMVASENSQPSWTGLGWDLTTPFIERRYTGCSDDGGSGNDLCWAGDVLELSLNGHSSPLVKDRGVTDADVWRPRDDPGWRVERRTGADNGDDDGEYWVVVTPDGLQYTFGRGAQATTGRATNAVFTVPVYGNGASEPCHAGAGWCQQAWRWNLDSAVDSHGVEASYFYTRETNSYARAGTTTTPYTRGGYVSDIEYGLRSGAENVGAPARLHFTTALRCTGIAGGGATSCPALTSTATAADYPDVPTGAICSSACTIDAPTFFTGVLLSSVTSQRRAGDTWSDVDVIAFDYRYPAPSDGTASLWLNSVQQTGKVGGSQSLPRVTFSGTELRNRVERAAAPLPKLRVNGVTDELGRRVEVTYGTPDACDPAALPSPASNTRDCFPGWRGIGNSAGFGWWYKYLVTQVKVVDGTGGSPDQTTSYRYGGTSAWHYDDTPATPLRKQSWGDWRGYAQVDVVQLSDPAYRGENSARALSDTRSRYFRGMDGDRAVGDPMTGMGSRRFSITDSTGASVPDDPWLTGRVREVQHLSVASDGTAGPEIDGTLTTYGFARTTLVTPGTPDPKHDAHLVVQSRAVQRETVTADPGGARTSRSTTTDSTYDTYGQPVTVTSTAPGAASAGGGSDVRCTRTTYARDAATVAAGLLAYPYRIRDYAGSCASPTALVRGADTYYDGSATLGAPVSHGDHTRTVTAVTANGVDTVASSITTSGTYDPYGRITAATDGNGNTTRTGYEPATGIVTRTTVTNPLGQVNVTTSDPARSQVLTVRNANAGTTTTDYDPLGRVTGVRLPGQGTAGMTFAYSLDPDHASPPRTTTRKLLTGSTYVTSVAYLDSLGRDRQTQTVSEASTDAAPRTVLTDTRYDDRGLVAARTLPLVADQAAGARLVAVGSAAADETRTRYDAVARPVASDYVARGTVRWTTGTAYFGDHSRTTPPSGGVVQTVWTDIRGRRVRNDQGAGAALVTSTARYDDADRLVRTTDPAGHAVTSVFDLAGHETGGRDPDAGSTTAAYDGNGNQTASIDAAGVRLTTEYDALNRPKARWQGPAGTGTRLNSWTYDATGISNGIGRVATQTTYDDGRTWTQAVTGYDPKGQVSGRRWTFPAGVGLSLVPQVFSTSYTYDELGHQTSIRYPDRVVGLDPETVTTGYDRLGNPTTLTGATTDLLGSAKTVPYVSATGYAADGKLLSRSYADDLHPLTRRYGYDADTQRLAGITTEVGSTLLGGDPVVKQDDRYRWDDAGNLTSIVDDAPQIPLVGTPTATCYAYDSLSRLSHSWTTTHTACDDGTSTLEHSGPAGYNESWTYSPDGNLTSARSLLVDKSFAYDDANHPHAVTRSGVDVFGYDAVGQQNTRLKGLETGVMSYTPQHQLATVVAGVKTTKFVYAADGSRLARLNHDTTATLYIDGQEITIAAGIAKGVRYYSQGGTLVASRLITGTLTWQLGDTQGSAQIAVVAGTGVPVRTYYDPYGRIRDLSAKPLTDHGFLGDVADPLTGLDALGARYYDPDLGRFTSPDPLSIDATAQTANAYAYAANNPGTYSDPTGLCAMIYKTCPSPVFGGSASDAPTPCGIAAPGRSCVENDGKPKWNQQDAAAAVDDFPFNPRLGKKGFQAYQELSDIANPRPPILSWKFLLGFDPTEPDHPVQDDSFVCRHFGWCVTSSKQQQQLQMAVILLGALGGGEDDAVPGGTKGVADPYPNVLDPRTGEPIPNPAPGLTKVPKSERVPWGNKERGEYITEWYDRGYPTPKGGWSEYDIHHITPREYGGTNDFDNLVPVLRPTHQQEFSPWWIRHGNK